MAAPLQSFIDDPMSTAEQFDVVSGMHIQRSLVNESLTRLPYTRFIFDDAVLRTRVSITGIRQRVVRGETRGHYVCVIGEVVGETRGHRSDKRQERRRYWKSSNIFWFHVESVVFHLRPIVFPAIFMRLLSW